MEKFIFINSDNEEISLGDNPPFILTKVMGVGGLKADVKMQKAPFQDGKSYIDTNLEERIITLHVTVIGNSLEEIQSNRRLLNRVFNPKLGKGTLKYESDVNSKEIEVVVHATPDYTLDNGNVVDTQLEVAINLIAPSPFWMDILKQSKEFKAWLGGMKFSLQLPMSFAQQAQQRGIINNGDVSTPIKVEFLGPASNPQITNLTTNKFIRIKRDLLIGEKLIINTEFGNKKVTLIDANNNETNGMHYLDLDSIFWNLVIGDNQVRYDADSTGEHTQVTVFWKERFMGV